MSSAVIGALRVNLGMSSAAFEKGAARAESRMASMQRKFGRMGRALQKQGARLSIGITAPLVGFAKASIDAQKVQEQAEANVKAALKSMGDAAGYNFDQLNALASAMQDKSLYGDEAILQKVTANLLTFGNVSGDVFKRTQQLALDMSARMDTDLKSSAIMLGKALNDPVKGLSALSRVGIQFSEQQEKQIKGFVASGNLMAAQVLILKELEKEYGGAAEAIAATDSGKISSAMMAIGDAMEKVGAIILPMLAEIAVRVKGWAVAFQNLSPDTQTLAVKVMALAAAIGPLLVALGFAVKGFAGVTAAVTALTLAMARNPLLLVAVGLAAVTVAVWQNWAAVKAWAADAARWIGELPGKIGAAMASAVQWARDGMAEIWAAIVAEVKTWPGRMFEWGKAMLKSLWDGLTGKQADAIALQKRQELGMKIGRDITAGLGIGIAQARPSAEKAMRDTQKYLADVAREEAEIKSPSRVFMRIGAFLMEGLGLGIARGADGAAGQMSDAAKDIVARGRDADVSTAVQGWDAAMKKFGTTSEGVFEGFGGWLAKLIKGTTTLRETLANALSSSASQSWQAGLTGLGGAFKGAFGETGGGILSGLVSGLFSSVPAFASGTDFHAGGLARVNEMGGEIMNLPRGTQIIPHDVSMQMARSARAGGGQGLGVTVTMDESTGKLGAFVRNAAGQVVASAAPGIVRDSVDATYRTAREVPLP